MPSRYLIDTHTFIWIISDPGKLSKNALEVITNKKNEIFVSVISFWEISLKTSIKKFFLEGIIVGKLPEYAQKMDLKILNVQAREACTFADLPMKENHKDPFDRMIIWQAITENMTLISKDQLFDQYKDNGLIKLVW